MSVHELDAQSIYRRCDPKRFTFQTTAELEDLSQIIGQPRAIDAVKFATGIREKGYNLFVMGDAGSGKRSLILQYFPQVAADKASPSDWCYVYHFERPHEPRAVRLPTGAGGAYRQDIAELLEDLKAAFATAFDSEGYRTRRQEIEDHLNAQQEEVFGKIEEQAAAKNLSLRRTPEGIMFVPLQDGQPLTQEAYEALSDDARNQIEDATAELRKEMQRVLVQQPRMQREARDKIRELDRVAAEVSATPLFADLRKKYQGCPEVLTHLESLQQDAIHNAKMFLVEDGAPAEEASAAPSGEMDPAQIREFFFRRYQVNLIVTSSTQKGAPIIYEDNPTYQNLIGRVEYLPQMGALTTDFTLIKAGALHKANGGYLILEARRLLEQPFAWEGLKRALQSGVIRIESPQQMTDQVNTITLEPEPIPLNVKVALLGDHALYYALYAQDPDFSELFKVVADFEETIERSPENEQLYARLIGTLARKEGLMPFDPSAVARVIEQSSRLAEDTQKLTGHVRSVADLLHEADYWAGEAGHKVVSAKDVQRALDAQIFRLDRMRSRSLEFISRGTVLIDTQGDSIGQVNGLSVIQIGEFSFGSPHRISARVRLGSGKIVDIEREVELGGPLHSKGVLILTGFIGARYGGKYPLALSASLVFEQSYNGVDGDSASSAELYALLSAIGEIPLKQSLAVTGSVNQHGQVQAIGGVNEKIEGFFDVCQMRGLTGDQGVLIPAANVPHLMLRHDVVESVSKGKFHIYPVETIDQGIELLTGVKAGKRNAEGRYPKESVNGKVEARLSEMAQQWANLRGTQGID